MFLHKKMVLKRGHLFLIKVRNMQVLFQSVANGRVHKHLCPYPNQTSNDLLITTIG